MLFNRATGPLVTQSTILFAISVCESICSSFITHTDRILFYSENCTDPNLGSDHFCGACQGGFCAELSSFARCEYETSSQQECVDVGGSYNGLSFSTIVVPKCIRPTTTQSECFPPAFCTSVRALF